jgi:hypothetical protein
MSGLNSISLGKTFSENSCLQFADVKLPKPIGTFKIPPG